jgi:malate dehydrogenase (oxaloacetate-decarboxylating)(NADP+)
VRRSNTLIAALMVHLGDADAMLCGLVGKFDSTWPTSRKSGPPGRRQRFATVNA